MVTSGASRSAQPHRARSLPAEGVGNPAADLEDQKQKVRQLLGQGGEGSGLLAAVPIGVAISLSQPGNSARLPSTTSPRCAPIQLKDHVRAKEVKLSNATVRALTERLVEQATYQGVEEE